MLSTHSTQNKPSQILIITIDGPAGAGKSTVAKKLAHLLNISYLDTGAMYRGLTLKAMQRGISLEDETALVQLAKETTIDLTENAKGLMVLVDGKDVSQAIRSVEVTNNTFYIARAPKVREIMVEWQQSLGRKKSIVAEGRDLGTVVFPQATYKFYLDADINVRTKRRFLELKEKGKEVNEEVLIKELKERDNKDMTRKSGPLRQAKGAICIDTSHSSVDQVVELMLSHIKGNG